MRQVSTSRRKTSVDAAGDHFRFGITCCGAAFHSPGPEPGLSFRQGQVSTGQKRHASLSIPVLIDVDIQGL